MESSYVRRKMFCRNWGIYKTFETVKIIYFYYEILLSSYFKTYRHDILASNGLAVSNSSNSGSEITMKTIPMEEYTRLVRDSVQLYKAQKTIEKLTKRIEKNDATILGLKKKLEFGNISPVSLRQF